MTVSVTLRGTKGSALTYQEVDQNFEDLADAVNGIDFTGYVTTATSQTVTGAKSFTANTQVRGVQETVYSWGTVSAGTITIDASSGTVHRMTLGGAVTISAFTNPQVGQSATLVIAQDSTGNRTLTSTWKFAGGTKTLSTASGSIDVISVFYDGTDYLASLIRGFA